MALKLLTLNIEGDNHYDTIFPFVQKENPDVICMQEVYKVDLPHLQEQLHMEYVFLPLSNVTADNPYRKAKKGIEGVVVFSKLPVVQSGSCYYESQPVDTSIHDSSPGGERRGLLWVDVQKDGETFRIATTHFTWSPNGSVTALQRGDLKNLLESLQDVEPDVLCGDFNAPRGKEIFDTLATHFTDNVPKDITTSIDQNLHRVKGLQYMVDGFFTDKSITVNDVRVIDGVSDHCAIVGAIERKL
ncbi:MAG: endonuclease/exonuclease/phosphatase family protein [Candidatus Woesebacteria bacterium]